jgi:hypothetical protein
MDEFLKEIKEFEKKINTKFNILIGIIILFFLFMILLFLTS